MRNRQVGYAICLLALDLVVSLEQLADFTAARGMTTAARKQSTVKWKAEDDDVAAYTLKAINVESGRARRLVALEEEKFAVGMRHAAMDLDAHDGDENATLDFDEFARLVCMCCVLPLGQYPGTQALS